MMAVQTSDPNPSPPHPPLLPLAQLSKNITQIKYKYSVDKLNYSALPRYFILISYHFEKERGKKVSKRGGKPENWRNVYHCFYSNVNG